MMGVELMLAVVGIILTLATTVMTFSLKRLTGDVHHVRILMQEFAKEQAADRLANEKRLGWLESEARASRQKVETIEGRLLGHLLGERSLHDLEQ